MGSTPTNPTNPNTPVPMILITADDVRDPETLASLLNAEFQNLVQKVNALMGAGGTISFTSHVDMQGNNIRNVGSPQSPTDVVTKMAADSLYSAPALAPQIEATGPYPLQTYRQLSNPNQKETNTSHLNRLGNTAPDTNSSTLSFGAPSGGFVPVTVSSGIQTRADGSSLPYAQLNDSVPQPASFSIASISRTGGVVTGSTTGVNTLATGETVQIAGVTDASYDGSFVLTFVGIGGSPPGPVFQFNQAGANSSSSGGTISLFGISYYVMDPAVGKVYRVGPFPADTSQNRLNALQDRLAMIAVVAVTTSGGDTTNSAAGATSPIANTGGGNRILNNA